MKKRVLIIVLMLVTTMVPLSMVESQEEQLTYIPDMLDYDYYEQATVVIFGSCDSAYTVGFSWRFGLYIPLARRTIHIVTTGENESLNVVVLKSNQGFGIYLNHESMHVRLTRAKGIFFWGGKSLLTTSNIIVAVCNARSISLSY